MIVHYYKNMMHLPNYLWR